MVLAYQKDEALLIDIRTTHGETRGFRLWWLGQSGFLLQWQSRYLLLDPYLSDSLTLKYAATDKPHVRMSEQALDPSKLGFVDVVTSSHNHTDHLDAETLRPILAANPNVQLVVPEANRAFVAERLGCAESLPIGMNDTLVKDIAGFRFYGIPSAHNTVERDELGHCKFMGYVVEFGEYRVYHSGDTLWYDGLDDLLLPFAVDVAMLPINGNRPERRVAGNLNPEEAARLGKDIGAGCVIPHHYHLFAFNTEDPDHFVEQAQRQSTPYCVLRIGEKYSVW
jgi:L-ascorbate metabolism protein UlaG (beta-lactamase superfamily)